MNAINKPLIDENGEIREITDADLARMRPAREVFPPDVYAMLTAPRKTRGANKAPTKAQVTLRLDQDVLAAFKSTGKGWQSRINEALRREMANV